MIVTYVVPNSKIMHNIPLSNQFKMIYVFISYNDRFANREGAINGGGKKAGLVLARLYR